jgi:hypothetical protein
MLMSEWDPDTAPAVWSASKITEILDCALNRVGCITNVGRTTPFRKARR